MDELMFVKVLVILAVTSLAWSAVAEQKFQKLTGAQIRAKFSGMELSDDVHWYDLYERNGILLSSSMGRKEDWKMVGPEGPTLYGRWRVFGEMLRRASVGEQS